MLSVESLLSHPVASRSSSGNFQVASGGVFSVVVVDVHVVIGNERLPTVRQLQLVCVKVVQWVVDRRVGRSLTLVKVGRLRYIPWLWG